MTPSEAARTDVGVHHRPLNTSRLLFAQEQFADCSSQEQTRLKQNVQGQPTPESLARKSYIYIYIRKLNFLGSLFWRGFGEILERFWREILETKSSQIIVFSNAF